MSREEFKSINFKPESLVRIKQCNDVIAAYAKDNLKLTLRQLYYVLVSADLIKNEPRVYKNLGNLVSDARLAGMMDWEAIEDRGRPPHTINEYENLSQLIEAAIYSYRLPRWKGQENYVELWVEKDALSGVLQPLAKEFHVTMMVNKGYSSQSAMYAASKRFIDAQVDNDLNGILFYLGDHDPSGEDMVRDIEDRLTLFGARVEVRKLALTMTQIDHFKPPPNIAKMTDSRANAYVEKHGHSSWEVDALPPRELSKLIKREFAQVIDMELMDKFKKREVREKAELRAACEDIMSRDE